MGHYLAYQKEECPKILRYPSLDLDQFLRPLQAVCWQIWVHYVRRHFAKTCFGP